MNILLFRADELGKPLSRRDPRARHLLNILQRQPGDSFDTGLINGPRGKGSLISIGPGELTLSFVWTDPPPPLSPIHLLVGLPRPQTARDILREMTTLGISSMHFIRSDRGEASYASSSLWKNQAWDDCLLAGAAQAFCTRLPGVTHGRSLAEAIASLPAGAVRIALDNYEGTACLDRHEAIGKKPAALAVGSERGWSAAERNLLRESGFDFADLGPRVLRTETACIVAVTLLKTKLNPP